MRKTSNSLEIETFFSALTDRTRLRLLNLMSDQEVCVCFLVEVLQVSQPKISRHLAYLRHSGLVSARREGKWMHYSINPLVNPYLARFFQELKKWFAQDHQMLLDRERFLNVCCCIEFPAHLLGIPRPSKIAVNKKKSD
ncbi:MAG: metalloregulator ArsR/SmtB family transcription factor [Planctomycetota bacterium]